MCDGKSNNDALRRSLDGAVAHCPARRGEPSRFCGECLTCVNEWCVVPVCAPRSGHNCRFRTIIATVAEPTDAILRHPPAGICRLISGMGPGSSCDRMPKLGICFPAAVCTARLSELRIAAQPAELPFPLAKNVGRWEGMVCRDCILLASLWAVAPPNLDSEQHP